MATHSAKSMSYKGYFDKLKTHFKRILPWLKETKHTENNNKPFADIEI
jgi:hypothetical protein